MYCAKSSAIYHCTSEEADQRIVRHTMDALAHGYTTVVVWTIATDVLVLLISILGAELDGSSNIFASMVSPDSTKYFNIMENAI